MYLASSIDPLVATFRLPEHVREEGARKAERTIWALAAALGLTSTLRAKASSPSNLLSLVDRV